jgi:hypothetical protein
MFIRCRDDKWFTYCNRFDSLVKKQPERVSGWRWHRHDGVAEVVSDDVAILLSIPALSFLLCFSFNHKTRQVVH